jgi:hypothetical protein
MAVGTIPDTPARHRPEVRWRAFVLLAAVGVAAATFAHGAVTPEHLAEMPYLGWCFFAATVFGGASLVALRYGSWSAGALAAVAGGHALMLAVGIFSRTLGLPMGLTLAHLRMGLEAEPVTGWWLVAITGELAAVIGCGLALGRLARARGR